MIPEKVNEIISLDFYGLLPTSTGGVRCKFFIKDLLSKLIILYPIEKETTKTYQTKLFDNYFTKIGKPQWIFSDNGIQFTSQKWETTLE